MSEQVIKQLKKRNKQLAQPAITSEGMAKALVGLTVEGLGYKAAASAPGQTARMKADVGRRARRLKKRIESIRGMIGG